MESANRMKTVKWVIVAVVALFVVYGLFRGYADLVMNPSVVQEIRANPDGERARRTMLLTFAGGRQIPVNYLREANQVYVGADGPWWREFTGAGAPVTLEIRNQTFSGHGRVVLDNPEQVADVFARLRPTAPAWLPDWASGKLVVITLDASR